MWNDLRYRHSACLTNRIIRRRKKIRYIKLSITIFILCFLWWKYTCFKVYEEYTGTNADNGILNKIFQLVTEKR